MPFYVERLTITANPTQRQTITNYETKTETEKRKQSIDHTLFVGVHASRVSTKLPIPFHSMHSSMFNLRSNQSKSPLLPPAAGPFPDLACSALALSALRRRLFESKRSVISELAPIVSGGLETCCTGDDTCGGGAGLAPADAVRCPLPLRIARSRAASSSESRCTVTPPLL